jgi:pilus assembly protein CpaF
MEDQRMTIANLMMIFVVLVVVLFLIARSIKKNKEEVVDEIVEVDDKTYTLDKMIKFVKKRLDEITKINLYDIGLSEEELNDKKYVKELIYDLLAKEYGVDETNISKAIPFDIPSILTAQDKFDILIHEYKKTFSYEALTELIKKYNLAALKYVAGETKPCYVITSEEIDQIYEQENLNLGFADKLEIVVQRIYQQYKGYSSIDEVRDMNIDGVSGRSIWTSRKFLKSSCSNRW